MKLRLIILPLTAACSSCWDESHRCHENRWIHPAFSSCLGQGLRRKSSQCSQKQSQMTEKSSQLGSLLVCIFLLQHFSHILNYVLLFFICLFSNKLLASRFDLLYGPENEPNIVGFIINTKKAN